MDETHGRSQPRDDLPLDSDLEVDEGPTGRAQAVHVNGRYLGLVFAGGVAGTAAREYLTIVIPRIGEVPIATVGINIVGAFLLGALLEALIGRRPDEGRRRTVRLLLGTGFLGGFTTYSALATDTVILGSGGVWLPILYALGSLVLGAIATWAGIAAASTLHRRRPGADG